MTAHQKVQRIDGSLGPRGMGLQDNKQDARMSKHTAQEIQPLFAKLRLPPDSVDRAIQPIQIGSILTKIVGRDKPAMRVVGALFARLDVA